MTISGSKLTTVAADENEEKSQANQDAIDVTTSGETITITVNEELNSFPSTNPAQGTGEWVGLVIDTGESDITNVTYNGSALTQDDVDEAASVGVGAGSFVLWLKADSTFPKTIVLGTEGKADTTITIELVSLV